MTNSIIQTENLHRIYRGEGGDVHAVNDVSLTVEPGKVTAIIGRSGAGKTTLLNLMSGPDQPDEGKVWLDGKDIYNLNAEARASLRREKIGFIFQNFGLLPLLTAAENVSVPLRMRRVGRSERDQRIDEALQWVRLEKRANHRPFELSGGEQQRVAIARALAARPEIILADEPTGQLDSQTGRLVLNVMRRLVEDQAITMIIVTHDPLVMDMADKVYHLQDGQLVDNA